MINKCKKIIEFVRKCKRELEKLKKMFGAQDMTVGNPMSVMLKFAIPLLIGNLAQQLYSTVDAIIVGNYEGDNALAAVGAANPLMFLMLALFMGIATGSGIVVSQYFGAKNREMLSKVVGNIMTITFISTLFIMVFAAVATYPILRLLGTPAEIIDDAAAYLLIVFIGFIGCAYYNMIGGVLRGMGDSIMPLIYLLITCGLNIVLDLVFVAWFQMGVPGVAYATVISQVVSAVLCVKRLTKMGDVFDFKKKYFKLDKELVGRVVKIGMPAGLTQAIFACAGMVVQSLTNSFGPTVIATSTVIMRVDGFAMLPNFTFAMTMTTYVGQNIGAGNLERVNTSVKTGMKLALMVCVPIVIILFVFGKSLMMFFTDTPEVVNFGMEMLRMLSLGYIGVAVGQVLMGMMRGAGDTMTPMVISVLSTVVIRVPIAYIMAYFTRSEALPNGAPESIFYSLLISWVLSAVIAIIFYKKGKWRKTASNVNLKKVVD